MISSFSSVVFQSTLSVRRATFAPSSAPLPAIFQSTLSVRRATCPQHTDGSYFGISIHALREESDHSSADTPNQHDLFQSTLSVRRATSGRIDFPPLLTFQSTLSVRRATSLPRISSSAGIFQSTLSVRRATLRVGVSGGDRLISIHALREESDPLPSTHYDDHAWISIHALREESDAAVAAAPPRTNDFNPRSP